MHYEIALNKYYSTFVYTFIHIWHCQVIVQRSRTRQSIHRVKGVQSQLHPPIQRRVYSVTGPNALWYLDGNHKLIRWNGHPWRDRWIFKADYIHPVF